MGEYRRSMNTFCYTHSRGLFFGMVFALGSHCVNTLGLKITRRKKESVVALSANYSDWLESDPNPVEEA